MVLMWGKMDCYIEDTTFEGKVCADDATLYFTRACLYGVIASLGLALILPFLLLSRRKMIQLPRIFDQNSLN
jgi:hypothetical protein